MDISTAKLTIFPYRHVSQYVSVVVCVSFSSFYTIYFRTLNFQFWKCSNCICHKLSQKQLLHYVAQPWFIISDQYYAESLEAKYSTLALNMRWTAASLLHFSSCAFQERLFIIQSWLKLELQLTFHPSSLKSAYRNIWNNAVLLLSKNEECQPFKRQCFPSF